MDRKIINTLLNWYRRTDRKPLVLRGARQVGKTWVIRYLSSVLQLDLLELNFEREPHLKTLFQSNDPKKTILQLEAFFNRSIDTKRSLLFLDEIQAAPELLAKLRWFAEEKPELAVIATGSLLDFALSDYEFSMPVGRINYLYLEPLSFEEFLMAQDKKQLCEFLTHYELKDPFPEALHDQLWQLLREYVFVGGLPAAVSCWREEQSLISVHEVHQNLLTTFRDDFSKYAKRISHERLNEAFGAVPKLLGKKFKYSAINPNERSEVLKDAFNLLCLARVCSKVFSCSVSGIPIDATVNKKSFKAILLDVGLSTSAMGLVAPEMNLLKNFNLINSGRITEQFVGQMLRVAQPDYMDPQLYYWLSEKAGSVAEVDYVIQHQTDVIPIEVKSGKTGTLRSLHTLMKQKHLQLATRFNADVPSFMDVNVEDYRGEKIQYQLLSLPLYMAEQIHRILNLIQK